MPLGMGWRERRSFLRNNPLYLLSLQKSKAFFFFFNSKIRFQGSFCSCAGPSASGTFELLALGLDIRLSVVGVVVWASRGLVKMPVHLGPSEDQTRAWCHHPRKTPGPAGWRWGSYFQPWGCDFPPGSPSVHTPLAWVHRLWLSPQPQLFCSRSQEASRFGLSGTGTEVAG